MTQRALTVLTLGIVAALAGGAPRAEPPGPVPEGSAPPVIGEFDRAGPTNAEGAAQRASEEPPTADPAPQPDEPQRPTASPLHDAAAELIRDFICHRRESCLERHGERLTRAAHRIIDVCLEDPEIPRYVCLGFVANISNEGGGLEHPSCAGLDQACVRQCDTLWKTKKRHDCFLRCARAEGVQKGSRKWELVSRCNDRATARGPFQMKPARVRQCRKLLGEDFDPFDLAQAARCTMQLVKRSARAYNWPCGLQPSRDTWLVAMKRVGAGVRRKISDAEIGRFVPTPSGGTTWIPPRPAIWKPICSESGYGLRGLRYYRACGEACAAAAPAE